jgi:hypothetical protein
MHPLLKLFEQDIAPHPAGEEVRLAVVILVSSLRELRSEALPPDKLAKMLPALDIENVVLTFVEAMETIFEKVRLRPFPTAGASDKNNSVKHIRSK